MGGAIAVRRRAISRRRIVAGRFLEFLVSVSHTLPNHDFWEAEESQRYSNLFKIMARPKGFEPLTPRFVVCNTTLSSRFLLRANLLLLRFIYMINIDLWRHSRILA